MQISSKCFFLVALAFQCVAAFGAPAVELQPTPPADLHPLAPTIHGRATGAGDGEWRAQWPGVYAEAAFTGTEVFLRVGAEPVIQHILVDGTEVAKQVKPSAGVYRVSGLSPKQHRLRVEIASENQAGPVTFGGFATRKSIAPPAPAPRRRQMEFIGDSHTVGYGNTSPKRDCTQDEVWATTDTSQTFGPLVARHYDADYAINAISGRGIVRNYDGFAADPLPVAYPFTLFDKGSRYDDDAWKPDVIVISLGTNDFSTPLKPGEHWQSRDELHADYETTYVAFLAALRARHPRALFVLWATDMAEGEIQAEVNKVVQRVAAGRDSRVVFLPVNGLAMSGCDWHPSVDDDGKIAKALIATIDAQTSR